MVTRVSFEDFPAGTSVTTQYAAQGVLFNGERIVLAAGAPSGTNVLRAHSPADDVNPVTSIRMRFTSGLRRVRLRTGVMSGGARSGTLQGFDSAGNLLVSDGPRNVTPNAFTTLFNLSVANATIVRAELHMNGDGAAIDDLELDGEAPAQLPTTPPTLQITSPTASVVISDNQGFTASVQIAGRVRGEGMPTLRLTSHLPRPPDSLAPTPISEVPLAGSGINRTFSINPQVTLGPSTFTLTATNIAGLSASAEIHVTYLPDAIRRRFQRNGGTGTFGNLQYGATEGDRHIAMYDRGAISLQVSSTVVVQGAMFDKWMSLRDRGAFLPRLGAPLTEPRPSLAGATAQDFSNGRVYAGLPSGTHYVPSVFVNAIDQLGGENSTGLPTGDPTHSEDPPGPTWLFQRFFRPDFPQFQPSTLEVRGSPPRLFVERQGGYAHELRRTGASPQELTQMLNVSDAPTIWYSFPCADPDGPCTVADQTSRPPLENAGERYCNGTTYPHGPPQWSAVRGQYRATPIMGIVNRSHRADNDNPLTHEHFFEGSDVDPFDFPSDWNVILYPLDPYRNLLRRGQSTLEIEFEEYYALHFFVGQNAQPTRGDLVFASGRWIIDCGHDDYNAEIHPPFVLARLHTVVYKGHQATEANIWVNGWFPGDPVEFNIYPPPRPSPNATLSLVKPVDRDAALDVTVAANVGTTGDHIQARFSASRRRVPVTDAGEMKWQFGRGYEGTWYVYWSTPRRRARSRGAGRRRA